MNKLVTILISVIILLGFSFCSATRGSIKDKQQENPPFKVTKSTFNTWVGGQPGVKGFNVVITIDNPKIQLDSVYFRERKAKLKKDVTINPPMFIGVFTLPNTKHDYILHENSEMEYSNKPLNLNIPYSLKNNEAVVSYFYDGTIYYYKINKVEEVKSSVKY
ncbi:MAG: hypothetical protein QM495_06030 [Lutibacter sp.]|uniref:hypothetical protein n=1 Tax=Lutibacter sp. TaxID=1925666 RepID=UPI00385CDCB4